MPITMYFWLVTYDDGMALAEFDPNDWTENPYWAVFSNSHNDYQRGFLPKLSKITSIGWFPFSDEMVHKIVKKKTAAAVHPEHDDGIVVFLNAGDIPYLMRETKINYTLRGVEKHYVSKYKIGRNKDLPNQEYYEIDIKYEIERFDQLLSEG